jgi:hypothetical protein
MIVCVPHELYRTPRLRQAAGTLSASGGDSASDNETEKETLLINHTEVIGKWKITTI